MKSLFGLAVAVVFLNMIWTIESDNEARAAGIKTDYYYDAGVDNMNDGHRLANLGDDCAAMLKYGVASLQFAKSDYKDATQKYHVANHLYNSLCKY